MSLTVPYEFDSSGVVKAILRLVSGVLAIVALGIAYSVFISRNPTGGVLLVVVGVMIVVFGRVVLANFPAAHGTIMAETVIVHPVTLYGLRLPGSPGQFDVQQFQAVRVERASGPVDVPGGPNEKVSLVGRDGTPDILIARTDGGAGMSLARELATALGLQYQEQRSVH